MRVDLARRILTSLENAVPESIAQLRGSLADERFETSLQIDIRLIMNTIDTLRIDRNTFSVTSLFDESDEKAYWLSKTPHERLEAMELMRQINYGYDSTTARIQRILEIAELTQS
jgi:hypothetical protein